MGDVLEYLVDGVSGLSPGGVDGAAIVCGVCSLGTPGQAYLLGKSSDLSAPFGCRSPGGSAAGYVRYRRTESGGDRGTGGGFGGRVRDASGPHRNRPGCHDIRHPGGQCRCGFADCYRRRPGDSNLPAVRRWWRNIRRGDHYSGQRPDCRRDHGYHHHPGRR